jgi:DNA polymerase-3 subunit delta'
MKPQMSQKKEANSLLLMFMEFNSVVGQTHVKEHLLDALKNGRIAHAQLFLGSPGTGGLPLALAYANLVVSHFKNGSWNEEPDPSTQAKTEKFIHPDIHFVFPVNKTADIKPKHPVSNDFIHLFREALIKQPYLDIHDWYNFIGIGNSQGLISVHESADILKKLSLKPFESYYKVMIIWMPEMLNLPASNKILKILEEPPERTLFLLVAEDSDKLLTTILSRTQIVKLDPLSDCEIAEALEQRHGATPAAAKSAAHLSSGDFHKALELLMHNEETDVHQTEFRTWMRLCFSKDVGEILKWCEKTARNNRENLKIFLEYGLHIFRESLIMNYGHPELQRLEGSELEFTQKFAPFLNSANCISMIQEFEKAITHVGRNANAKILLFDLSIQVMKLIRVKPLVEA